MSIIRLIHIKIDPSEPGLNASVSAAVGFISPLRCVRHGWYK
jgi:hypothetical protein